MWQGEKSLTSLRLQEKHHPRSVQYAYLYGSRPVTLFNLCSPIDPKHLYQFLASYPKLY